MRPQHWTAAAWLLERKYPLEFGKTDRREEKADEPVQLTLGLELEVMTDEDEDAGAKANEGEKWDGGDGDGRDEG